MNKIHHLSILAVLLLLFSGCAMLQEDAFDFDPGSDEGIAAAAASRLNSDGMTARATLSVNVENGRATLYGTVPDPVTRERAIQILQGTPGVIDVRDHTRRQ